VNKLPLFLCPPRTRSTLLMEMTYFYLNKKYNLKRLLNHNELFTEFNFVYTFNNQPSELIPFYKNNEISIHSCYPYIFKDTVSRNLYKFNILKQAKEKGINYHLKITLPIVHNQEEFLSFFNDRKFIVTKRKNNFDLILSYLFAKQIKMFTVRENTKHKFNQKIKNSIFIQNYKHTIENLIKKTKLFYDFCNKLNCEVVFYEDLDNEKNMITTIAKLLEDDNWFNSVPKNFKQNLVQQTKVDFIKTIKNYQEVKKEIEQQIEKNNFYD